MTLKILIITPLGDFRGGAEKSLFETIKILVDSGHQLTLVTSNTGDFTDFLKKLGVRIIAIGINEKLIFIAKKNFIQAIFSAIHINYRLLHLIKKNPIDILYVHTSGILTWVFITIYLKNIRQIIIQERSGEPNVLIKWLYRLLGKRLTVVFNSNFMKNKYCSIFGKIPWKKDYVLYPPIDLDIFYPKSEIEKLKIRSQFDLEMTDYLIVCAGRICRDKQIHHIIEAINLIPESKKIHLAIVGMASNEYDSKYEKFLRQMTYQHKINENIHFVGFKDDISSILSAADLLILPSKDEPFGRVILEAQASGTPVIAADSGGAIEAIDYDFGMIFETGNVKDLAEKICNITKTTSFQDNTSIEKIREHLMNRVSLSQHKNEVLSIINQIR